MTPARWFLAGAVLATLLGPHPAAAGDGELADLRVRHLLPPLPRSLAMRAAAQPIVAPASAREPASQSDDVLDAPPPQTLDQQVAQVQQRTELAPDLAEQVVFSLNLGFGLDGGAPSGDPLLSGADLEDDVGSRYEALRSYAFGDVALGTRGLAAQSLSTYLASHFRINQNLAASYAVPSVYDGREVQEVLVRSAYGEIDGIGSGWLEPVRIRAGRQFRYGPAIAHFDGLTVAYETRLLSLAVYSGRRVSYFGFGLGREVAEEGTLTGGSVQVALGELIKVPLVVSAEALRFDELRYFDTRLAYQFDRNNSLLTRVRWFEGKMARQALLLRSRLSRVTTISAELQNRTENDFVYDLLLAQPLAGDATDPRRYLSFGLIRPRVLFNVRAGTVFLRNIDVLLRGGFAADRTDRDEQTRNTFAVGYAEIGGAFEVRLRRSVRLGSSILARTYRRDDRGADGVPGDDMAGPLIGDTGAVGETNFVEGGVSLRYSTGARRFTASGELYGRQYWFRSPYDVELENRSDNRTGGRFSVEGWAGDRLRIRGEYDVARVPELFASELRRVQTLRVLGEGRF